MPLSSRSYGQSVGRRPPWVGGLTHARRGGLPKPAARVFFGRQVTEPGFSRLCHFVVFRFRFHICSLLFLCSTV